MTNPHEEKTRTESRQGEADQSTRMIAALSGPNPQQRLQAAMAIGTDAQTQHLDALIVRCRVEPDFFVRDMLTWALTRLPADDAVPRLIDELDSETPQAISQSLHTLSKIGDARAWPAIDPERIGHRFIGHPDT